MFVPNVPVFAEFHFPTDEDSEELTMRYQVIYMDQSEAQIIYDGKVRIAQSMAGFLGLSY